MEGVRVAIDTLSESENAALGVLSGVLSRLRPLTEFDGTLRGTIAVLESGEVQLREAAYALKHYADRIELDPKRLRDVEQRLEAVHDAARKFRRGRRRCLSFWLRFGHG
jgi:DNA repair protein RecN (Recombination protein N)